MCLRKKPDGQLSIDLSGDSTPFQIKFYIPIDRILSKKRITLEVDPTPYNYYKNYILGNDNIERSSDNGHY